MPRRNSPVPHQRYQFSTTCASKSRYASDRAAQEAGDYQMLLQPNLQLSTYHCEQCGGWHLTRRPHTRNTSSVDTR